MSVFSSDDKQRISQAITKAEASTSGEIVVVVAKRSDDYRFTVLMWAALIALTLPLVLIYAPLPNGWRLAFSGPEVLYLIQLIWFIVLALLFQLPVIRHALVPQSIKALRTRRAAIEQFIAQDLHTTPKRTGVLIYVSLAERQAEIIADDGINKKVDQLVWQNAVDALTAQMGNGNPADGFISAINQCGTAMATHYPPGAPDTNEHPNHLIELDDGG
ncbi:MAG: hypothetical protein GY927_22780 [bacterium]|nr:hypothetical protein [bacterium]